MTIRAGMTNLVNRVRSLTNAGTAEYTAGSITYWSDTDIQNVLDSNARFVVSSPLAWTYETTPSGMAVCWNGQLEYRDIEESPGTVDGSRFMLKTSTGTAVGTASYTVDYRSGRVTFGTVDQGGSIYYATLYTYDVHAAAADVWLERLAHFNEWYAFRADNQTFNREQAWEHAYKMESKLRGKAGQNMIGGVSGDVHLSMFVRTDINATSD